METASDEEVVLLLLTRQIVRTMRAQAIEETCPSSDADRSDGLIRDCKARVQSLQAIRTLYEQCMFGNYP